MRNNVRYLITTGAAALLVASGCVSSRVNSSISTRIAADNEGSVVLLSRRQRIETETEGQFVDCVRKRMQKVGNGLNFSSESAFLDQLYPWFEPRIAPLSDIKLREVLARPGVSDRVRESGVRYIVWLDGSTELTDGGGQLTCDLTVGCFGFNWWEKGANYEASIWDLENATVNGVVTADVTGRSYLPAIVVPIPLIARTLASACDAMATTLKDTLLPEAP